MPIEKGVPAAEWPMRKVEKLQMPKTAVQE